MFKMGKCNSIKPDFHKTPNTYPNISNKQQFRLNKINEIKDYLLAEIREKELISKNLSKYFASFEYFSKSLTFFNCSSQSYFYCIIYNSYWSTCRNIGRKLWSYIFNYIRICKKVLKTKRNKKKKHNKIVMLARSKLNSIESKISKALMDNEISHEDFETIINEEKKY